MKFFRSLKSLFVLQAMVGILLVLLGIASSMQIVVLHYPRVIDNDPLVSPVGVTSVSGDTINLVDGRRIEIQTQEPLSQLVSRSNFRIDLESFEGASVMVYVKERGWLCGTPWVGLINIPLIADDVPINRRVPIGIGRIVSANDESSSDSDSPGGNQ